jgi:hypothetical protein
MLIVLGLLAFTVLRWVYGFVLFAVLFVPFGIYNTMTEPYLSGAIWGFMLPVGYVAAASGVAVILYPRSKLLRKLGFGNLLALIGFFMLLAIMIFPRELAIRLLYGATMIDTDYSTFTGAIVWLSVLNIVAGLMTNVGNLSRRTVKA